MVRNSDKTYGQLMQEAASKTDFQEVGETMEGLQDRLMKVIEEAVNGNYEKGIRGKYYIHIWVRKEPYANNTLHIFPQCRRTRPSPYQADDHFLWSVTGGNHVKYEWSIPNKQILGHILANPLDYDADYVNSLRRYTKDKIENISDYLVDGKVI